MKTIATIIFIFLSIHGLCQFKVIAKYDTIKQDYELKWYSQDFVNLEGVNVFFNVNHGWKKLNSSPITSSKHLNLTQLCTSDDSLLINTMGPIQTQPTGFEKAILLIASVKSRCVANYLGIYTRYNHSFMRDAKFMVTTIDSNMVGVGKVSTPSPSPTIDTIVPVDDHVQVLWQGDSSHFAYYVHKCVDGNWEQVTPTPILMTKDTCMWWYDSIATDSDTILYSIQALDFFGDTLRRGLSNYYSSSVKKLVAPTFLPLSRKRKGVSLKWTSSEQFSRYYLYRSINGQEETLIYNGKHHQFTDPCTISGNYLYKLIGEGRRKQFSNNATATFYVEDFIAPPTPWINLNNLSDSTVTLHWNDSPAEDIFKYHVYRGTDSSLNSMLPVGRIKSCDTLFTESFPTEAKSTYYYCVVAIDSNYNSSPRSNLVKVALPDYTAPLAPVVKNIELLENGLKIRWFPNSETDLKQYRVYRKDTANYALIGITTKDVTTIHDTTIQKPTEVTYKLAAEDTLGNISDYTMLNRIMHPGSLLDASLQNIKIKKNRQKKHLVLSWNLTGAKADLYVILQKKNNRYKTINTCQTQEVAIIPNKDDAEYRIKAILDDGTYLVSHPILVKPF